jgi:hypothetical protein
MKESDDIVISRQVLLDEIRLNRAAIQEGHQRERRYVTWTNLFSVLGLLGLAIGTALAAF